MKPPLEMPIELPHDVCVAAALGGLPEFSGPCHSDAVLGEPGLFQAPQAIVVAPSVRPGVAVRRRLPVERARDEHVGVVRRRRR